MGYNILENDVFTYQLTNNTLTIEEDMGLETISIFNGTSVIGTVLGGMKIKGLTPTPIDIEQGETVTISSNDKSVIKNLIITAPNGCTLKIIAQ